MQARAFVVVKRESQQIAQYAWKWLVVCSLLGAADLAFGIVRQLTLPWNAAEWLLVCVIVAILGISEWLAMATPKLVKWMWARSSRVVSL